MKLKRLVWKLRFLEKNSNHSLLVYNISYDHRNEVKHLFVSGSCSVTLIYALHPDLLSCFKSFSKVCQIHDDGDDFGHIYTLRLWEMLLSIGRVSENPIEV